MSRLRVGTIGLSGVSNSLRISKSPVGQLRYMTYLPAFYRVHFLVPDPKYRYESDLMWIYRDHRGLVRSVSSPWIF